MKSCRTIFTILNFRQVKHVLRAGWLKDTALYEIKDPERFLISSRHDVDYYTLLSTNLNALLNIVWKEEKIWKIKSLDQHLTCTFALTFWYPKIIQIVSDLQFFLYNNNYLEKLLYLKYKKLVFTLLEHKEIS